ncbi:RNA polymerase sigma factor [Sneathiella marina]|uniref:RNA polymerase sigma factor n=1 Tax=Sneathiella marina TaxID=2950108 RepID=A0ABY4W8A6_9PROT|nr:RNA polymerase sigma factor [Sneathiella marina]USG61504.1 RNA polymerase sigma factor [Sneathiella marina]
MAMDRSARIIEQVVREEWGRVLSIVVSYTRDLELAEDVTQDAVIAALTHWNEKGIPISPLAWLVQTARRKAIDRIRRHRNFERKRAEYEILLELEQKDAPNDIPKEEDAHIPDERLRLVFTCCHPALAEASCIALTLRTLGGLTTAEIARAFLVSEETMAQRLVRAKRKIRATNIPYEVPEPDLLEDRLQSVLSVLYLIFNEGFSVTTGENLSRLDLCDEAIRLTQMLNHLMPDTPEIMGLLALMLLHDARKQGRVDATGAMVPLNAQDRSLWHKKQITAGSGILKKALKLRAPGPYQIQAAISAIHAESQNHDSTDWQEISLLYERLFQFQPSPIVQLNSVVAQSYAHGPEHALRALCKLENTEKLTRYQPFYAAKADISRRAGQFGNAVEAYEKAIDLSGNQKEKDFLINRLTDMKKQANR